MYLTSHQGFLHDTEHLKHQLPSYLRLMNSSMGLFLQFAKILFTIRYGLYFDTKRNMFYNANKQCRNHLRKILNCLYDAAVSLPESHEEMEKLLTEAKVQGLTDKCQAGL